MTTIAQTLVAGGNATTRLAEQIAPVIGRLDALRLAGLAVPTVDVASTLSSLLDVPLRGLALKGWRQYRDVAEARRSTAEHPGTREVVELLEHRIESRQSPAIEVTVEGVPREVLALDLLVEIEATTAQLVIEHGEIVRFETGPAVARGTLSAHDVVLASHEFQAVDLSVDPDPDA
jgi:hypothetical protein